MIFACVCATDLYIAQKRLDSVADAAALAGSDGFALVVEGETARAVLSDAGVHEQAAAVVAAVPGDAALVSAEAPDGLTARVTVASTWHPPLFSPFVPDGVALEASATSRTALR